MSKQNIYLFLDFVLGGLVPDEAGRVGRGVVALRALDQTQTSVTVVHLLIIQFLDEI